MSDQEEIQFRVGGMSCASCELTVGEEIEEIEGVASVTVDRGNESVLVRGRDLDDESIAEAVTEAGYEFLGRIEQATAR